jgi:hypothetical protein
MCVKTAAESLKQWMPDVCRTPGCSEVPVDGLGHCPACRARYQHDRRRGRELAAAARQANWDLMLFLDDRHARRLAEHIVGNARIGRGAILYAFEDFIAEAQELAAGEPSDIQIPARRPRLRLLRGGAS